MQNYWFWFTFCVYSSFSSLGGITMNEIKNIICNIKKGQLDEFEKILIHFNPLITKYARKLFKNEFEDSKSELTCALWEAILNLEYYENEGQIISYLSKSVFLRYLELYKSSKRKNEYESCVQDEELLNIVYEKNDYDTLHISDFKSFILSHYTGKKYIIVKYILLENLSDSEISLRENISRQYVNRVRRELKKYFSNY